METVATMDSLAQLSSDQLLFNGNNPKDYSGFHLLPDEIVRKIVKMALSNVDVIIPSNNCICPMGHSIKVLASLDMIERDGWFRDGCLKRTILSE